MENITGEREMNSLTQLTAELDEFKSAKKKKCPECGEVKSLTDFTKDCTRKNGVGGYCKICFNEKCTQYRNTEKGYLKLRYSSIRAREFLDTRYGRKSKCLFTRDEFFTAWEEHKSIYGMKSAWGPGIDHLEQHLPLTMIQNGNGRLGKPGSIKGSKKIGSNLSIDRLDPERDYTLQNILFIRSDENDRKKHSTYNDCLIQIRLHDKRFIKTESK